jgi:hypothetical protein
MLQRSRVLMLCLALGLTHAQPSRADEKATAAPTANQAGAAAQPTEGPKGFAPGKEPTKFLNLPFGTSLEDAKKLYPKMEVTEQVKIAQIFNHPFIERYTIGMQKIEGLEKPCEVELRFWKKKFWLAVVSFGENTNEAVEAFLISSFGPENHRSKQYVSWTGTKAAAVADIKVRWYEVHDETISNDVRQTWLSGGLRQTPLPATAKQTPASGTAAPAGGTPAAATPVPAK